MSSSALAAGLRHLRGKLAAQQHNDDSDEHLLHVFLSNHDDHAFAVLVRRHGPMVLHVCRRVLGHEQDAEDAFQATFLVLARQAARLRNKSSLASWLYGIASRIALKAKRSAARQRKYEVQTPALGNVEPSSELLWREVRELLDAEIARLPEKYRSVFVLYYLEDCGREETARRLGLKTGTVASRLDKARKRLQQRLGRHGLELTAVLAASALATPSALSAELISATVKAALGGELLSAQVVGLARSAASAALVSKTKFVTAALFAVSVLAGIGAWCVSANRLWLRAETPSETRSSTPPGNEAAPRREQNDEVIVKGHVVGPDGKPVKGARLYSARVQNIWPRSNPAVALAQPQPTGTDGRFQITINRPGHDELAYLVAYGDGLGVDWIDLSEDHGQQEVTLRLPNDVPIAGRVVNTEGRPVAGVSVSIAQIWASANGNLDDYLVGWLRNFRNNLAGVALQKWVLLPLDGVIRRTTTDKDGRFTLHGAGSERIVHLAFSGAGVARSTPWVITRPGFDTKPYNAVLRNKENEYLLTFNRFPGLFPPSFTFIAEAGRTIEGVVKDAATGKPLAGCQVFTQTSYGHGIAAFTDAEGKYRLDSLAKRAGGHFVSVRPPKGTVYLGRSINVEDAVGFTPIRLDFELAKGAIVTGRVLDRQTGKPLRCYVRSVPLPGNKFFGSKPGFDRHDADEAVEVGADGRFRLATIPGKALLMARVLANEKLHGQYLYAYRRAEPDPDHKDIFERSGDRWRVFTAYGVTELLDIENAVKVIDIKEKGENRVEMFADRGATVRIHVQDSEGKPLAGAWATGLTDTNTTAYELPEATATVYALNPDKLRTMPFFPAVVNVLNPDNARKLAFYHAEKKLGGIALVRGDEKGPIIVKLAPVGKISGRLLDGDGNPLEGVEVSILTQSQTVHELYRSAPTGNPVHTDKDGRFCIESIVPGLPIQLNLRKNGTFFNGEPRIGVKQLRAGEALDLGAVHIKPAR